MRRLNDTPHCSWHVYLLRCGDGTLYCGVARNLAARVAMHNRGRGAKYTRTRLPVEAVWSEQVQGHSAALVRECEVKRMTRGEKLALISNGTRAVFENPKIPVYFPDGGD